MLTSLISKKPHVIEHPSEDQSNQNRLRLSSLEAKGLRTYTPSLAVISRSEGCYHYTADHRKLADFTSGVLVANLGHNPARWWQRIAKYMGFTDSWDSILATRRSSSN